MKKRWIALALAGIMTLNLWMPAGIYAHAKNGEVGVEDDLDIEEGVEDWGESLDEKNGKCGENSTWELSDDGTLTIAGSGAVSDSSGYGKYKEDIKTLVIKSGITDIGKSAFEKLSAIKGDLELPESVKSIGESAFYGTSGLDKITIKNAECEIADSAKTFDASTALAGTAVSTAKDYADKYDREFICVSHVYGEWTIVQEATCTEAGSKKQICLGCSAEKTESIEAKGHSWEANATVDQAATCIETGSKSIHCSVCSATKNAEVIDALGHSFTSYKSDDNETCTADGTKTAKCDRCETTDTIADTGSAKGHSYTDTWSKNTEEHWKECSVCYTKKDSEAHNYSDGECLMCGQEQAHVHELTLVSAAEATCEADGIKAYYKCSGCDEIFEDAEGKTSITDKNSVIVKAKGHSYTNYVSNGNATCTTDGTKTATCDRCDVTNTIADIGSANGHSMKYIASVEATCEADGTKAYYECTVCEKMYEDSKGNNEITDKDTLVIKTEGHSYTDTWNKDADIHWIECTVCFEKTEQAAHTFDSNEKCTVCEYEKAHIHSLELTATAEATCTKNGNVAYYKCSGCDSWFEDAEGNKLIANKASVIVNALGHEYDEDGICIRCNHTNPELPDKVESVILFVKEKATVDYTGAAVTVMDDYLEVEKGTGTVVFTYYLDKECEVPTFEGTEKEGMSPTDPGRYYVKATIQADGNYKAATADGIFVLTIRPRKVVSAKVVNNKSTIKISWEKREEADGYIIYRRKKGTSSSAYKTIATITDNATLSYSDGNIKQGSGYIYTIRAYADAADGTRVKGLMMSSAKKIVRTKVTSITNQNGSVKIKWTKVDGAAGYKVYRKSVGENTYKRIQTIKDGSQNYYVDKSSKAIKNGKASYYYIKPYYEKDNGYVLATNKMTNYYVSRPIIASVTGSKKAVIVKWNKNSRASGYQIRYSTSKTFDSYKTVSVSGKSTISKKLTGLLANKKYYVKVRTYKTYGGMKYYSGWSKAKEVRSK